VKSDIPFFVASKQPEPTYGGWKYLMKSLFIEEEIFEKSG